MRLYFCFRKSTKKIHVALKGRINVNLETKNEIKIISSVYYIG